MTVVSDSQYQSTLDAVYVYVVPWSEFPMVPSYPHYPQVWGLGFEVWIGVSGSGEKRAMSVAACALLSCAEKVEREWYFIAEQPAPAPKGLCLGFAVYGFGVWGSGFSRFETSQP